jgi:Holliday junction resolvasome RuvABC endonuclease subunit
MNSVRLLSVDPSLTCTGWALFSIAESKLLAVGKLRTVSADFTLSYRLKILQEKVGVVFEKLQLREGDVLVCESPTTMRDPRSAFIVEQVRCIFETLAREKNLSVPGRINPRSVHYEVLGLKGKQMTRNMVKNVAVNVVQRLYSKQLSALGFKVDSEHLSRNQDIVDAILIGGLTLTRIKSAELAGEQLDVFFDRTRIKNTRRKLRNRA